MSSAPKTLLEGLEGRLLLAAEIAAPAAPPPEPLTLRAQAAAPPTSAPLRAAVRPVPKSKPAPRRAPAPEPVAVRRVVIKSASANGRAHAVTVTWNPLAGATRYRVERSADARTWASVGNVPGDKSSFMDVQLAEATTYWYRVWAELSGGLSAPSAAMSATTANFRFMEALRNANRPLSLGGGVEPAYVVYGGYVTPTGQLDESGVRAHARLAQERNQILVFDIEHWPLDIRTHSREQVNGTIAAFQQLADWSRDESPGLKVGFYGEIPRPSIDNNAAAHKAANDYLLTRLVPSVDALFPSYYTLHLDPSDWVAPVEAGLADLQAYGKPVYPFVMPDFLEFTQGGMRPVPPDYWQLMLGQIRRAADGLVIWTASFAPWDPALPWWQATTQFIRRERVAPPAPAGLTVAPSGAVLNWVDTSGVETGFFVERSSDGVNYQIVGGTTQNVTTWSDSQIVGGATYHYRVRALNEWGASLSSSPVSAAVSTRALLENQAERFEAGAGVTRGLNYVSGLDNGEYLLFRSMDFAQGADQFSVSLGVPDELAGQHIEIRLDSLAGPVIGKLTLSGTGDWIRLLRHSAPIAHTAGVHDVYLVFRAREDGFGVNAGLLDSFRFAASATPAAPERLLANSTGGKVELTWVDYSQDETGFVLERSPDGVNFTELARLPANTRAYTDAAGQLGVTYHYRVRSANAHGRSAPSNTDQGLRTTRSAFGILEAESADTMWGVTPYMHVVLQIDGGDFLGFYGVDFGSTGAGTFVVRHAVAQGYEGQLVDVRLDHFNGPVIATLTTQATGPSFNDVRMQYIPTQRVTGVHDVYFVYRGNFGTAVADSFTFLP